MRLLLVLILLYNSFIFCQDSIFLHENAKGKLIKNKNEFTAKEFPKIPIGEWNFYNNSKQLILQGTYINSRENYKPIKQGKWYYFNNKNEVFLIETYRLNALINQEIVDEGVYEFNDNKIEIVKENENVFVQNVYQNNELVKSLKWENNKLLYNLSEVEKQQFLNTKVIDWENNLVSNPSFEIHNKNDNTFHSISNTLIEAWYPAQISPDYYLKALTNEARTGDAMLGIRLFSPTNPFKVFHIEYIQNELKEALQKDAIYCVGAFVKRKSDSKYIISNFGIDVHSNKYFFNQENNIQDAFNSSLQQADIVNQSNQFLSSESWMCVGGYYIANGDEKYLTIGPFQKIDSISSREIKNNNNAEVPEAYYYLDDVFMYMVDSVEQCFVNTINKQEKIVNHLKDVDISKPFVLDNIQFEYDKDVLLKSALKDLDDLITFLKVNTEFSLIIEGHTSTEGEESYNFNLSKKRAESVLNYLVKNGIKASRLSALGKGETESISTNNEALNRRVVFKLVNSN